ncbi:MAG: ribbon-helix-helix protein, CopG family [Candidatus Dadabacteria bacterium]|nr:MAG: ribbon-helix-helix protein, CopG family [Candidatus Dadabacteria bacterium]
MKTAISIPDDLLKEAEEIAKEQNFSRSALFTIALREYLERIKSQRILYALNKAYSELEPQEEIALRQRGKKHYATKILKERY